MALGAETRKAKDLGYGSFSITFVLSFIDLIHSE
jgi:hypothetical protein